MKFLLPLFLAAGLAASALAAPPPGHPSPEAARELLLPNKPPRAAELPNEGSVVSTINANEYTSSQVKRGAQTDWIAAPRQELKPGTLIRFEEGAVMTNFHSKLLQRTFPRIMFVGFVAAVPK